MPSLRILDGQRFDPAFVARKARRAARPPALDPAEPTTSANAEPVGERPSKKRRTVEAEADDAAPAVDAKERKKRKKERKAAADDAVPLLALPKSAPAPEPAEPPAPPDARDRSGAAPRERTSVVAVIDVAGGKKGKRKAGPATDGAELAAFFGGPAPLTADADDGATGLSLGGW